MNIKLKHGRTVGMTLAVLLATVFTFILSVDYTSEVATRARISDPVMIQIAKLSEYGKSAYDGERTRDDLLESEPMDDRGVVITTIHDEEVYHPVNTAWFILSMQDSFEASNNPEYLEHARINTQYLLDGAERTHTGTWFAYHFEHSPGGLDNGTPWVSGMAQGMLLSVLSRMYEITGEEQYKDEASRVFQTYFASKSDSDYWFVNQDDCNWIGPCLYFEEYPSRQERQNAHVVNGFIYSIWGIYDYIRVFQDPDALPLFNASVITLEKSFDRYRYPEGASWYAMNEFGYEAWGRPEGYHIGVTKQLEITSVITGSKILADQARTLSQDCSSQPCEVQQ